MTIEIVDSYDPISEQDLQCVETRLGYSIPNVYRKFLKNHNGGYPKPSEFVVKTNKKRQYSVAIEYFFGIQKGEFDDLEYNIETYRSRIPSDLFPIACDPGGNLVCISTQENLESIYFWDHEFESDEGEEPSYSNVYLVAETFKEFMDSLK